jgi:hypothetical protein
MTEAARTSGGTEKTHVPVLQNRKTATFELRGDDGKMYSGDFTFKRLTIAEVGKVGAEIARLNGGNPVDKTTEFINTMLAHFRYAIVAAPEWWNADELYDLHIVKGVFELLWEHEQSFRPSASGQGSAAPQAS